MKNKILISFLTVVFLPNCSIAQIIGENAMSFNSADTNKPICKNKNSDSDGDGRI